MPHHSRGMCTQPLIPEGGGCWHRRCSLCDQNVAVRPDGRRCTTHACPGRDADEALHGHARDDAPRSASSDRAARSPPLARARWGPAGGHPVGSRPEAGHGLAGHEPRGARAQLSARPAAGRGDHDPDGHHDRSHVSHRGRGVSHGPGEDRGPAGHGRRATRRARDRDGRPAPLRAGARRRRAVQPARRGPRRPAARARRGRADGRSGRRRHLEPRDPDRRGALKEAVLRVRTINPRPVVWALEARGFTAREAWR